MNTIFTFDEELTWNQLLIKTIISSLSVSGMLSSLQYTKRLYKVCITNRIIPITTYARRIGNIAYFLLRPFYCFCVCDCYDFCIIIRYICSISELWLHNKWNFLYFCVILSSFIGFSVGQLLDEFESIIREKLAIWNKVYYGSSSART